MWSAPTFVFNISIWANSKLEPTAHILLFPLSLFAFHGDKMNSALNLINPQRFHVLIPKVKGVIVLTNEVSVPPSGNKGKKEQNTGSKGRDHGCSQSGFLSLQLSWWIEVWYGGKRPCKQGLELSAICTCIQVSGCEKDWTVNML